MWELAPSEVLDILDADVTIEKRASWEAFEFTYLEGGDVKIVNGSHDEPSEHSYTVHAEGGIPAHCSCPAFEYHQGICNHMIAVAICEPLLEAVSAEPSMKADGGIRSRLRCACRQSSLRGYAQSRTLDDQERPEETRWTKRRHQ